MLQLIHNNTTAIIDELLSNSVLTTIFKIIKRLFFLEACLLEIFSVKFYKANVLFAFLLVSFKLFTFIFQFPHFYAQLKCIRQNRTVL